MTPPPDPGRAVAEARDKVIAKGMFRNGYIQQLAEIHLKEFEAAVRADERARLLSGQQDADAHGEALRRHEGMGLGPVGPGGDYHKAAGDTELENS